MMKNRILVLALLALLVALFGCAAPKYQFCCFYDEAFPEDPADAVCMGMNASGEVETLSVVGCDEEDWSCTISIGLDGAEDVKVPVCPNIVTTKCNSSCVGVFCGNFFYDPRPSHGTIPSNEAHAAPDEGKSTEDSVTSEPVGLWQAECRVEEMTSLFMRQVENSGEITLNTFRFGIGDSFQDFEDAQLYFPLTDKACELNPTGTTDRYVVYAIPNRKSNGNPLCNLQTVQLSPPINENKVVNPGISFSGDASVLRVVDACTKHSDCLPGELCDLLSGVCIDACTQAQCTGGDVCIGGYCVPPAAGSECSTDGDCPDGEVCANGYCKWDLHLSGCTKNIDCPVGRVCYSGQCVDACSQAMCSEGTICIGGYCVPPAMGTECTSDSDCEIWEACANGYCKWNIYSDQNCYIDAHCQVGQECIEGECRAPCTSDSDCGTGWFCAGDGYCSEAPVECYYHSDCEPGEVCSGGYCILDMGDFDEPPELSEVYLPSEMYVCSASSAIKSYSYFDCASRCALQIYGYKAEIDPFNPYLSIYDGERIGNPFAYAPNRDSYSNDRYPNALYNGINFLEFYRDKVGPLEANDADAYAYGSVLYGATFGDPILSQDVDTKVDLLMLQYLASEGYVSSNDDSNKIPYLGKSSDYYFFDWNWDSQSFARNTFLTVENSPHEFYPWLLAHHSVYNEQFEDGHYSAGGTYSTGAEFECQTGMDCLSGYCNNFDYKRGVCVGVDGEDILCDCVYENGETLCTGMGTFETASWDNPGVDVEIPVALSAAVDETLIGPPLVSGGYNAPAYLPSFGRVVELSMGEGETLDAGAGSEEILKAPFFIMPLGGGHSSSYYGDLRLPDYTLRSWEGMGDSKVTKLLNTIDLCSAVYSGGKWSRTLDGTEYVFCCDGTISCDTVGEGETNKFVIPSSTTGEHMTRFVENCMGGYKEYISVCFSPDAKSQIGTWGWSGDSPIVNIIGGYKFLTGKDGDGKPIYEIIPFCRFIGEEALGEDDPDEIKGRRCYQWASGGHYPLGTEDTCVAEAESYLVIEPRRVEMEDGTVRWAYGNCLINSQGDGLELREYGICESCGYLTMAKEEITALPLESEMKFDGVSYDDEEMYGNTYCPDMVVHTPHNWFSIKERSNKDTGPFGNYVLAPTGMSGYNSYEFGSYEWGGEVYKECTYPNGYSVNEDGYERGLPSVEPNAFYINRKLESFMKRNIQPVIFATDDGLWKKTAVAEGDMESSYDPEVYLSSYISVDEYGTLYYASQTVLKELFTSKEYLFEGMPDCQAGNPLSLDSCKSEYAETNTIYSFPGSFLGNTILNEGGAIIVVDKTPTPSCGLDAYCWSGEQYYSKVKSRSLSTQVICPNCMVSVAAGYGSYSGSPEGKFDMEERLKEISYIFQYVTSGVPSSEYMNFTIPCEEGYPFDSNPNFFCFSPMLDAVDVVSLNIVLRDGDEYCGLQGEERHDAILGNMTQLGIATMKRFGKPIVISDFTIDRSGSCWTEQSAANFMAYLSTHSDDLVKAGYLGLIYGDFKSSEDDSTGIIFNSGGTPTVPDYRGDFFSGMFTASRNFAGHEFITFYNEVIVSEECGCIPCGPGDSVCNGKYQGTGPRCDGYEPGMKWPEICIREDLCKVTPPLVKVNSPFGYVTTAADKIACDLVYNDGSKETVYFELSSIRENPGIYRDVIASLETNTPFCFPTGEGEGLITYVASKQSGYSASPLVFSKDGNQSVYCDPTSGLLDSFCGYYPPIGNYQMSCRFSTGEESQDEGATPGPGDMYDTPFVTS